MFEFKNDGKIYGGWKINIPVPEGKDVNSIRIEHINSDSIYYMEECYHDQIVITCGECSTAIFIKFNEILNRVPRPKEIQEILSLFPKEKERFRRLAIASYKDAEVSLWRKWREKAVIEKEKIEVARKMKEEKEKIENLSSDKKEELKNLLYEECRRYEKEKKLFDEINFHRTDKYKSVLEKFKVPYPPKWDNIFSYYYENRVGYISHTKVYEEEMKRKWQEVEKSFFKEKEEARKSFFKDKGEAFRSLKEKMLSLYETIEYYEYKENARELALSIQDESYGTMTLSSGKTITLKK